jgi:hypothetical protein
MYITVRTVAFDLKAVDCWRVNPGELSLTSIGGTSDQVGFCNFSLTSPPPPGKLGGKSDPCGPVFVSGNADFKSKDLDVLRFLLVLATWSLTYSTLIFSLIDDESRNLLFQKQTTIFF